MWIVWRARSPQEVGKDVLLPGKELERGTSGRIIKDGLAEKKYFPCLGEISGISGLVNGFQSEVSP